MVVGIVAALDARIAKVSRVVLISMRRHRAAIFEIYDEAALRLTGTADDTFLGFHDDRDLPDETHILALRYNSPIALKKGNRKSSFCYLSQGRSGVPYWDFQHVQHAGS